MAEHPDVGRIRPVGGLARVASVAVVVTLVARLVLLVFGARTLAEIDRPTLAGVDLAANERTLVTLGLIQFGTFLVAVTIFLIWLYRARGNAEALRPGVSRLGRGWALGAWFVPLANLVLGPMVVATTAIPRPRY